MKNSTRRLKLIVLGIIVLFGILLIPDTEPEIPAESSRTPFVWNSDAYWDSLETMFRQARDIDSAVLADSIRVIRGRINAVNNTEFEVWPEPTDPIFTDLESDFFRLGAYTAAAPEHAPALAELHAAVRGRVKSWSRGWPIDNPSVRNRLYRLLYGARTAVEEVLLQSDPALVPELTPGYDEPSATPAAQFLGVTVHSGDILVSRGGAPTSALIARGNDYPGNFSHVALVHVDGTGQVSIVESHIECGVAIADVQKYLDDTKLRILLLRPRSDIATLRSDPELPHKAAAAALERAQREHIPYDFAMDFDDNTKLFCSEVASAPYRQFGLTLWMGISHISSRGVRSWLAAFGVRHFVTQEPSDLEYDPQLRVVAEWRDPDMLWRDHLDNAVIDAMLERAEAGERLTFDWYKLPFGRVLKGYSVILNWFGGLGPIPEGMSASAALRNDAFSKRHATIKALLQEAVDEFTTAHGYRPPYWELVRLAREACDSAQ